MSRGAVKRPSAQPTRCNHCGGMVRLVMKKNRQGRPVGKWPWMYQCQSCRASVGTHPQTFRAMGNLATQEVREARQRAHLALDNLWRDGLMTRHEVYARLAERMGIDRTVCHIALFELEECQRVIDIAHELRWGK